MTQAIVKLLIGSPHERTIKTMLPILAKINELEPWAKSLGPEEFPHQTDRFRKALNEGATLDSLLPEAFALVREAARRTLGERPFDVQLLGGIVLHQGKVMEMKTGEGKTLSCTTSAYLNALPERGVHIVTVNDYLAERDARWMEPVYRYLGISVGSILSNMDNEARREAYRRDITYGTNNEFGFDYLRDNMRWSSDARAQREHAYCIIDEIDSILIDEARTPLIISGSAEDDTKKFSDVNQLARQLVECARDPETGDYPEEPIGDYKIDEKSKRVSFTDQGLNSIERLLLQRKLITGSVFVDENFEYIHYFTQAVKASRLFHRDVDYVVQDGQVQIVDEFTGRILHGRRYSDGLHQAIEAKEQIRIAKRNRTLATITFQNFFRMYDKISGMTGTADTEAREFGKIYGLEVVVIPTNRPLVRDDEDDVIYLNESEKNEAICDEIAAAHRKGQPVLVGTVSIEKSERLADQLTRRGVPHEVLNAKNHAREALIISEAGAKGAVTIATNMAGRGTDIKLGGNLEYRARKRAGTSASDEEYRKALDIEFPRWRSDYEEVKSLGGLYVLGTERHEARRIDNQLRGRSGRQGDPGRSRFFISLDDDLMRLFSDNLKNLMQKVGMKPGEPIYHPWINKSIERAQNKVEERNFEIRKHLLDFDDVLNEQREFIYRQRDEILKDTHLVNRIFSAAEEMVKEYVDTYASSSQTKSAAMSELLEILQTQFFYTPSATQEELEALPVDAITREILDGIRANLAEKETLLGTAQLDLFIRYEYLRFIDAKWQDHLENLEALREAVYLRTYSQKNPLLEYKLEGFQIFDQLIQDIRTSLAAKIVKVRIQQRTNADDFRRTPRTTAQAMHSQLGQFAAATAQATSASGLSSSSPPRSAAPTRPAEASPTQPSRAQITRTVPKVGRNDPCPCGSGKKYKYCHGN
jgi:preprotein translocase subunit SecA